MLPGGELSDTVRSIPAEYQARAKEVGSVVSAEGGAEAAADLGAADDSRADVMSVAMGGR